MAKPSALDKIIKQLEAEIADHERAIEGKQDMIRRLSSAVVKKSAQKPRVVKKAEAERSA